MKYIVTSGCSFTRQYRRIGIAGTENDFMEDSMSQWKWPHFIQSEYPDYKVINYGNPTNDNDVIAKSILYGVNDLLKKGIPAEDIKVIAQWSGWSRSSFFISKKKQEQNNYYLNREFVKDRDKDRYPINEDFAHINDFIPVDKKYPGEHGYFLLSGGYHTDHVKVRSKEFLNDYVEHIFSADERMLQYLQSVLLIQYFCKANNIDYKCFTMHNNFSKDYVDDDRFPLWRPNNSNKTEGWHVVYENFIPSTWENDIKVQFESKPYVKYLFDMVDLNKFWFYKEEGITKYGGQAEWAIRKFNFDELSENKDIPNIIWQECRTHWDNGLLNTKDDLVKYFLNNNYWQHTSPYLNRKFVKEELKSFLDEK